MKYLKRMKEIVMRTLLAGQDQQSPYVLDAMPLFPAVRLSDAFADPEPVPCVRNVVSKYGAISARTFVFERGTVSNNTADPMAELSLAALDRFDFGGPALGLGTAPWEFC